MRPSRWMWVGVVVVSLGSVGMAQEKPGSPDGAPPMPKPGPEHQVLTQDVGVWDATVALVMEPGGKPEISKGTETNRLMGGLWLIQDFQGELLGLPFHGHSMTGYDPAKKKYVGTWVDTVSPGLSMVEGTLDPKTKIMTAWIEGPGPDGVVMKSRATTEWKDANTRVFTMHSPEGKGPSFAMMTITYQRRAAR